MKKINIFGFVIEIRKRTEDVCIKKPEVNCAKRGVLEQGEKEEDSHQKGTVRDSGSEETDSTDQLYRDALKCSKCTNKQCLCPKAANYILEVGTEEFRRQAKNNTLPENISKHLHNMDLATLMCWEVDEEYQHILEVAGFKGAS